MDIKDRFRGFLPVVIDLETGGFECKKHAVLEIAIVLLDWKDNQIIPGATHQWNIEPEANLVVEAASLEVTRIDLSDPNHAGRSSYSSSPSSAREMPHGW